MRKELKAVKVVEPEEVKVKKGGNPAELLEERRQTVIYSDKSSKSFRIIWDLSGVDLKKPGTYEAEGEVLFPEYGDILAEQRADPYVLRENGNYYFTASYPVCGMEEKERRVGYDRIILRRADSLLGLATAEEAVIWNQKESNRLHRYVWAPELHKIGDSYYILFTASVEKDNVWGIRPHMLKCVGDDLMNPDSWRTSDESNLYRLKGMEGDAFPFSDFSLDVTYFTSAGRHYLAWAQKEGHLSNIYLGEVKESEPWKLISPARLLTSPEYEWETNEEVYVNEGPMILKHNGKLFLAFSASAVDYTYCIGFLEADENADLLADGAWKKYGYPFLTSADLPGQCGPGHNSFTTDENGNVVLVYHARPKECSNGQDANGNYGRCEYVEPGTEALCDPCRHARAKSIQFAADGLPVLHLLPEEELPAQYRKVRIKVTVL